ncbi:unnamed protein product [Rangifer tarandus platyrhynchus]|uniref:Uncharacterized protein n=1 Tax=Rangifer tarandus platyrhynchus TaxID=3082113 RepID=A0ABN8YG13_RANTA|nr:unnamed protein product [Rangifer tarandus platyrhynchus]
MAASLLHYTAPQTCGSAGLAGHGESAPAAWLGSEAESSQGHKRQGCEERETATKMRGREETRAGALLPVRAAVKAGVCQGGSGRRSHPGTRGAWEAGAACARQAHLNIRLCHTRGAADNFITSADKNDCGRMQMASPVYLGLWGDSRGEGTTNVCGAGADKTFGTRGLRPSSIATPERSRAPTGLNHTLAGGASSPSLRPGSGVEGAAPRELLQNKDGPALE